MRYRFFAIAALALSTIFLGCVSEQYTQTGRHRMSAADTVGMLKVQDVIDLSRAGVSDSLIINMMDATNTWFKLKPQDVINLRNAGVSENVISAMMQQPPEEGSQSGNSTVSHTYVVYPYYWWWYDGFYPYWYYPRLSPRLGHPSLHRGFTGHRRFR